MGWLGWSLRPDHVLLEAMTVPRRYGTARRASRLLLWPVASSATQRRLARPGMAASPFGEMTVPGRFF
jgi:hypothetical protein